MTTQVNGTKYDNLLSLKFGGGFPYFVFLHANGRYLVQSKYPRKADDIRPFADKALGIAKKLKELKGKDLLLYRMELGLPDAADAGEQIKKLGSALTDEERTRARRLLAGIKALEIFETTTDFRSRTKINEQFVDMESAGQVPLPESQIHDRFWSGVLSIAQRRKNADLYEKGVKAFRSKYADNPKKNRYLESLEKSLKKLRE